MVTRALLLTGLASLASLVLGDECHLTPVIHVLQVTQGDYDGSGQRSCKCNYVDFYKDARPPC